MRGLRGLVVAAMLVAIAGPAYSQSASILQCRPTAALTAWLAVMNEARMWRGLAKNGQMLVELYLSAAGTWTLVVTSPTGVSCLHMNGRAGEMTGAPLEGAGVR